MNGYAFALVALSTTACAAAVATPLATKTMRVVVSPAQAPTGGVKEDVSECPPAEAGSVRDDETPAIRGWGETVSFDEWTERRGVPNDVAGPWLASHFNEEPEAFAPGRQRAWPTCTPVALPVEHEQGALCVFTSSTNTREHTFAYIVAVRNRLPAVVFETGLAIHYREDFTNHKRWLDLSLTLKEGVITVRDRAEEGTILVEGKAACEARYRHQHQCLERGHARSASPESAEDSVEDEDGKACVSNLEGGFHLPEPKLYPAEMHDCAHAAALLTRQRDTSVDKRFEKLQGWVRKLWEESLTFAHSSCGNRGQWVWRGKAYVLEH
jgi:hypothetical protein